MPVTKTADKKVSLVLIGRKSQYIAGLGILRRGKPFQVSEAHAKKLLAAKNKGTKEALFTRQEDLEEALKYKATDNNLDLGLVEKGTPKGGAVEIEEV